MPRARLALIAPVLTLLGHEPPPAGAVDICGNGADDDSNSLLDEGCNPEGYLKIREAPLPATAIGIIAPISGQQIWTEPPDFDVQVPYGPQLRLQRRYNSLVSAPDNQVESPLGTGWSHNYMTWIWAPGGPSATVARVRLIDTAEVYFQYTGTTGGWRYYNPQPGHSVDYLRNDGANYWELRTLEGIVYTYQHAKSGVQYLDGAYIQTIEDPLGNTLSVIVGTTYKEVREVRAPNKRLVFTYASTSPYKLIQVDYEAEGVTRATLTFPNSQTPTSASLGGTPIRNYTYRSGKLVGVSDGSGHSVVKFEYSSASNGKTVRAESARGFVGFKYGDSTCNGGAGVYQYFNLKDDGGANEGIACDTDAQCGSGYYCGGQTTPGTNQTGLCFRARRCVVTTTASDDLVGAVSSSCPTCTNVADRSWNTSALRLNGQKDAANVWTSYLYNGDGLVTKMVENDTDANASTVPTTGARATWFFYGNSTFPGLVTEVRRLSELKPGGTCTQTTATDCKRTVYTYTIGGKIDTLQEVGFTYNLSGTVISYSYTTDYDYDAQGRMTQVNGPRTDTSVDIIQYNYWTASGNLKDGYLKEVKRQKNATVFVTTTYETYDHWGNPQRIADPNGHITCLTYHDDRNTLLTRRIAMAGQTTCVGDPSDLVTTYTYDTGRNLTKVAQPEGNCIHYEYDGRGRLMTIKNRDNCLPGQAGDNQEFTYDDDGNLIKTEYKDATGAVTRRDERTFGADGRIAEILNPSNTAKKKTFAYKADGMLESITGEESTGKTEWAYDNLNRIDAEKRYNTTSTFDTWNLTPGEQLGLPKQVVDDDGKLIDWVWDDLGRKVKQVTGDAGTTINKYDEAGNLTDQVVAQGTAAERTHHFGYDSLNRLQGENWGDDACFNQGGNEIQHYYDDQSGCPTGTCVNSIGRPAKVRVKVNCDNSEPDDTFDQWTYFGYDAAGRLVQESIRDDGLRTADQYYIWDKNGNLTNVKPQSGVELKSTFGSAASNSDRDRIVAVLWNDGSGDVTYVSNGVWYPFGPLKQYEQGNTISGNNLIARFTLDLAYRTTEILWEQETSGTDLFKIGYTLDAQGRITTKDFTGGHGSLEDSYYTYDWQNRIICDSVVSGSCPTSGGNVKSNLNSSPPYTSSSDRRSIIHRGSQYPIATYTYTLVSEKDRIHSIARASQTVDFGWNARGDRMFDDDSEYADDRRDYTYDSRDNLITVSGKLSVSDTVVHDYTMVNAFDDKNRRFFKSLLDETSNLEEHWFYYYDPFDRLIEVNHTPDIGNPTNYTVYQFFWIGNRPAAWKQTNYPGATGSRRFFHSDHLNTPVEAYNWPASGDATRAWAIQSDAFGWAATLAGAAYQPLRFPGQLSDEETTAWYWDSASSVFKRARPPLSDNRFRTYDPFVGSYLQSDPRVGQTWSSYGYAGNNPVLLTDADGLDWDDGSHEGREVECMAYYGYCPPTNALDQFWRDWWINYEPPPLAPPTGGGGGGGGGGSGGPYCDNGQAPRECDPNYVGVPEHCFTWGFGGGPGTFMGKVYDTGTLCCERFCQERVRRAICENPCTDESYDECYSGCIKEGAPPGSWMWWGECREGQTCETKYGE
jgi:YD repeat-containing protein